MPFPDLPDRLRDVREKIDEAVRTGGHGQTVTIVAVTKTHDASAVQAAWDAGLRDVGENRIQEALPKIETTSVPVRWHLIANIQRNKIKAVRKFHLLRSLDSGRLADAVPKIGLAEGTEHPIDALVQVNVV